MKKYEFKGDIIEDLKQLEASDPLSDIDNAYENNMDVIILSAGHNLITKKADVSGWSYDVYHQKSSDPSWSTGSSIRLLFRNENRDYLYSFDERDAFNRDVARLMKQFLE